MFRRILFSFLVVSMLAPFTVQAQSGASISLIPGSGSFSVGDIISVGIFLSSSSQIVTSVFGNMTFSTDVLEAVSVSSGSVVDVWNQIPVISNDTGNVTFNGAIAFPGFKGLNEPVFTVNFKAIAEGTADIVFSSIDVHQNGTSVLSGVGTGRFLVYTPSEPVGLTTAPEPESEVVLQEIIIEPEVIEEVVAEPVVLVAPLGRLIVSPTHPDSNKWYNNPDPEFSWEIEDSTDAVQLLIGKLPKGVPSVTYRPPITTKLVTGLGDGEWYFHTRLHSNEGWGETDHFRLMIDTAAPNSLEVLELVKDELGVVTIEIVSASDELSGIDHFEVSIEGGEPILLGSIVPQTYNPTGLVLGENQIEISAVDAAGNKRTETFVVTVREGDAAAEVEEDPTQEVISTFAVEGLTPVKDKRSNLLGNLNRNAKNLILAEVVVIGLLIIWVVFVQVLFRTRDVVPKKKKKAALQKHISARKSSKKVAKKATKKAK